MVGLGLEFLCSTVYKVGNPSSLGLIPAPPMCMTRNGGAGAASLGLVLEYFEHSGKRWSGPLQQLCVPFAKRTRWSDLA